MFSGSASLVARLPPDNPRAFQDPEPNSPRPLSRGRWQTSLGSVPVSFWLSAGVLSQRPHSIAAPVRQPSNRFGDRSKHSRCWPAPPHSIAGHLQFQGQNVQHFALLLGPLLGAPQSGLDGGRTRDPQVLPLTSGALEPQLSTTPPACQQHRSSANAGTACARHTWLINWRVLGSRPECEGQASPFNLNWAA